MDNPPVPAGYTALLDEPQPDAAEGRALTFGAMGRLGAKVSPDVSSADDQRAAAQRIEAAGFGSIGFGESGVTREAFTWAGLLLEATQSLVVTTGIANIWARDAAAMHNAAATLAGAYPGRFVLGMGVSHPGTVSLRGLTYERPIEKMRGYLTELNQRQFTPSQPGGPPPRLIAAHGPKMTALAAGLADGVITGMANPEYIRRSRAIIGPDKYLLVGLQFTLADDPAEALALARGSIGYHLALPNYQRHLRSLGYTAEQLANGASDEVLQEIVTCGSPALVEERVRAFWAAGADHVQLIPSGTGALQNSLAALEAVALRLL